MKKKVDLSHGDFWVEVSMLCDIQDIVAPYPLTLHDGRSITGFLSSMVFNFPKIRAKIFLSNWMTPVFFEVRFAA